MATTNNVKLKLLTETEAGKAGSQTFGNVSSTATEENASAVLDLLGGMQSNTVTGKQRIVTENL